MGVLGRNIATAREYLRLLEEKDIENWIELWADDADHYYPFGADMFPRHLAGKQAIYAFWRDVPARFESLRFPISRIWADGDTVIVQFSSDNLLRDDGRTYRNSYVCIFRFNESGKIREYWEYFDPITAGVGFGLLEVRIR